MSNDPIGSDSANQARGGEQPKPRRKPARKAEASKKPAARKSKPKAERSNKKGEVVALIKRAKGATPAEIMKATGWQSHPVRGFVRILGKKGGEDRNAKSAEGERSYKVK